MHNALVPTGDPNPPKTRLNQEKDCTSREGEKRQDEIKRAVLALKRLIDVSQLIL